MRSSRTIAEAKKAFADLKSVPNISPRVLKLWELYGDTLGMPAAELGVTQENSDDDQSRRQDARGQVHPHDQGRAAENHAPISCSRARPWCFSRFPARSLRPAMPSTCRASSSWPIKIKAKGVDTIACTAVNDVFVMNAWGK